VLAIVNYFNYITSITATAVEKYPGFQLIQLIKTINLPTIPLFSQFQKKMNDFGLNFKRWREAAAIAKYYNIPDLLPALTLFVNEIQGEKIGQPFLNRDLERRPKEFEWVG
jgi:hypothetical protein